MWTPSQTGAFRYPRAAAMWLLAWSLAGCVVDAEDPCALGVQVSSLYFASREPGTVHLGPGQRLAVVALEPYTEGEHGPTLCTGTLIAEGWVLSAGHCVGVHGTEILFGEDADTPLHSFTASDAVAHPQLDVALFQLPTATPLGSARVTPIPLRSDPPPADLIGTRAEIAGRGETENAGLGALRFVDEVVAGMEAEHVVVDGMGRSGACGGDSGGPLLLAGADGGVEVAGSLSNGSASCVGRDRYVRADVVAPWAARLIAARPVPRGPDPACQPPEHAAGP